MIQCVPVSRKNSPLPNFNDAEWTTLLSPSLSCPSCSNVTYFSLSTTIQLVNIDSATLTTQLCSMPTNTTLLAHYTLLVCSSLEISWRVPGCFRHVVHLSKTTLYQLYNIGWKSLLQVILVISWLDKVKDHFSIWCCLEYGCYWQQHHHFFSYVSKAWHECCIRWSTCKNDLYSYRWQHG